MTSPHSAKTAAAPRRAPKAGIVRLLAPLDVGACTAAEPVTELWALALGLEGVPLGTAGVLAPAVGVAPPMGAVDWPLISAWTLALKVPVMPDMLC